jgi:RNA polymerase sigma-70 factor (ECF subfamily)
LIDTGENLKALLNISSDEKNAHQRLESDERNKMVRNAIDNLPEKQRTAFVLSKYDDLSQREIADIMKISEGAVEQLLQRAKANLQKKLSRLQ